MVNTVKDFVNETPDSSQVWECYSRYLQRELEEFEGDTILGLGATALRLFTSAGHSITKYRGTIFTPANLIPCTRCGEVGVVSQSGRRCPKCQGRGYVGTKVQPPFPSCHDHSYDGTVRTRRNCEVCQTSWLSRHPICDECWGKKTLPRPPKTCPQCEGQAQVPDGKSEFTSRLLKGGQLFFPTYHPAYLMRKKTLLPVVAADLKRVVGLHEELGQEIAPSQYTIYPKEQRWSFVIGGEPVALDLETTGLGDPRNEDEHIECMGASTEPGHAVAVKPGTPEYERFLDSDYIIGQNWTLFDAWWVWHKEGKDFRKLWDTRFAGHLLNPDTPNDIVSMNAEFASPPLVGYWKSKRHYEDKPLVACRDADVTGRIKRGQAKALARTGQLNVMLDNVMPMCNVVFDMRKRGMRIDRAEMDTFAAELDRKISTQRAKLPDWGGDTRSENQSVRIREYLYRTLRLPVIRDGDGSPTTRVHALDELLTRLRTGHRTIERLTSEQIREALVLLERIKNLRTLSKLSNTFLKQRLSSSDFIHPILNLGGTATLRLSCSDPNAQQIPRVARGIFIPDDLGGHIVCADLDQAEVIGFLWCAKEWDVLRQVIQGGFDAHEIVATMILNTQHPTKEERDFAKTSTFAFMYGEHPATTAARLGVSLSEVDDLRRKYFELLPGIARYRDETIHFCMENGYVESPFNVRRYIRVERPVGHDANQACNAPIQNIPAMVTRYAMIKLHEQLPKPARMLMQVHDEVVVTTPPELLKEVVECLTAILSSPQRSLPVPTSVDSTGLLRFPVTIKVGSNWKEVVKCQDETTVAL